jgi:signal transduction histidine kinase
VMGKHASMLLPEPHRSQYIPLDEQSLLQSIDVKPQEMVGLRKDGREFPMEISRSAWRSREGVFLTAIVRDISLRMELEQLMRLQEKMASLGRVAAGIAHEIRNPLTGINSYMYSLRKGIEAGVADMQERSLLLNIAGEIQGASNKIEGVIRRVMDFAKPGMPKLSLININQPIDEALKLSAATLRKNGIIVKQELAEGMQLCRADLQMIEQVMLNLITNAVQAMQAMTGEKHLELRSSSGDGHIVVTVSDSGPGIPPQERAKIFDPFYTTKSDGSGIGLSLCHRIITDHRGTLTAETSSWGGAEFRIELPVADPGPKIKK